MKKLTALVLSILMAASLVSAQQLQQLDDTDSLKQRREKTNTNFQIVWDKITQNYNTLNNKAPIQSYTRSTLPSGAANGTIATISDSLGGAWLKSRLGTWFQLGGEKATVADYSSLAAAVSAAISSGSPRIIEIPYVVTTSADLVVPDSVILSFSGTGRIDPAFGTTLTIQSDSRAWPLRQLYGGFGSVRFGGYIERSYPQWFGARADNSTDDSAAVQKAVDAFRNTSSTAPNGGEVKIAGPTVINSTITAQGTNVRITGDGWAPNSSGNLNRTFLRWNGSAGSPMILVHALGVRIENLHLIGKSSAKPSAAVEFSESGSYFADNLAMRDVWIGSLYGFDDDDATQFTRGVYFSGSVDGDTNLLERVFIHKATTGIDIAQGNASVEHFNTIQTVFCTTGIRSVAPQVVITNWIAAGNDVDFEMASQGNDLTLINYTSEGSGRMLVGSSLAPYRVNIIGGGFQADGSGKFATADGGGKRAFIQFATLAGIATSIKMTHFNLSTFGNPPTPTVLAYNTGGGATAVHLVIDECVGITAKNIDVGSDNYQNSTRIIEITPRTYSGAGPNVTRFIQNSTNGTTGEDDTFAEGRWDTLGFANFYGGPVKVKKLRAPVINVLTATGGTGTTRSYKIVALTYDGHSAPSAAATVSGPSSLDATHYTEMTWMSSPGAYAYQVYGRASGSEQLMVTLKLTDLPDGNYFKDDGTYTPSGALPSGNTTGNATIDSNLTVGGPSGVATANAALNTTRPYRVYVALLSQTGGDAPTATVLENTLGGSVVWSYDSAGSYFATLNGAFTNNKTVVIVTADKNLITGGTTACILSASRRNLDGVQLTAFDATNNTYADDLISGSMIEIRVYP